MSSHKPKCKVNSDHTVKRNEKYDAYECVICNTWVEDKCKDKECEFCSTRPKIPFIRGEKQLGKRMTCKHSWKKIGASNSSEVYKEQHQCSNCSTIRTTSTNHDPNVRGKVFSYTIPNKDDIPSFKKTVVN